MKMFKDVIVVGTIERPGVGRSWGGATTSLRKHSGISLRIVSDIQKQSLSICQIVGSLQS